MIQNSVDMFATITKVKSFCRYGMQNQFDPPRPAPNADGWSSGDDYLAWNQEQSQEVQQGRERES